MIPTNENGPLTSPYLFPYVLPLILIRIIKFLSRKKIIRGYHYTYTARTQR